MTVELAAAAGMPPPAGLPEGEFWCVRLESGALRIDRADPRILISAPLLYEIADGGSPWATVSREPPPRDRYDGHGAMEGALLKIHGDGGRTVLYRIVEYVPRIHAYICEWPD
jgi:hypothetical protein